MRYLSKVLIVLCSFLNLITQAQTQITPVLPKITPTTPEQAAFSRYGEYQVSLFTGIPDISIPLFEIKTDKFTVPITLSYHASGNKVNDIASWVGLGWSLSNGCNMSRVIMGAGDQTHTRDVRTDIHPYDQDDWNYLKSVFNKEKDTEPDIYSYSILGKSGRFIYDNSGIPIMIPTTGIKPGGYNHPNRLVDENGNIFYFDDADASDVYYPSEQYHIYSPPTSWSISKIVDANHTDSIEFSRQVLGIGTLSTDYIDYITVVDKRTYSGGDLTSPKYASGVNGARSYAVQSYGTEMGASAINFSKGLVKFIPTTTDRDDRKYFPSYDNGNGPTGFKSLDRIEVYSADDLITPLKTIVFYQSYFENSNGKKRLRLDAIAILDKDKAEIQRYKFDYNNDLNLPDYDSRQKDYWGYANGKYNDVLVPQMYVEFIGDAGIPLAPVRIGSGSIIGRDPDPNFMQANILTKITYPTGGSTIFTYETNKYLDVQNNVKYAGGLRVSKIQSFDENGVCSTKSYKYGADETGYGIFNVNLNEFSFVSTVMYNCQYLLGNVALSTMRSRTYSSSPCTDINPYDGSPVVYPIVTEYNGDFTDYNGKTVYEYTDVRDQLGSYVYIDKAFKLSRSFRRGLLLNKTVYKKVGGNFSPVSSLHNTYFIDNTHDTYLALRVVQKKVYECDRRPTDCDDYDWVSTPICYGDNLLTSSEEITYDMNNPLKSTSKSTFYSYNNHYQVSSITTNTSTENSSIVTDIKHPTDFPGNPVYDEMSSRNMLSTPILEEQTLTNGSDITPLYSKRTNFAKWNMKYYSPQETDFKTGGNPWETRILYTNYDVYGNLTGYKKANDMPLSINYDVYNQVIAEVANAENNTYYFNNFENSGGNSSPDDCKTGRRSSISGLNISLSGLKNETYTLSWWSKSAGIWVFNTQNIAINGTYNIILSGQIDDVRFYPKTSTMKTYTYDPLLGLTSVADENNICTYYEYDDFGRLKCIKDQNKNIMKAYNYHYFE